MPQYRSAQNIETLPHLQGEVPGCYELPVSPFDFLQPTTRQQVTQVGYGGPFVIRGNPIGAIVDAIRGFCFPAPMQTDGSTFTDMSGNGLGSYGDYTSPYLGAEGYPYSGPFTSGNVPPYNTAGMQCGSGTMWDAMSQMCVPTMPGTTPPAVTGTAANQCDDAMYYNSISDMEGAAFNMRDIPSLCMMQAKANTCIASAATPGMKADWVKLLARITSHLVQAGCASCVTCAGNKPAPAAMTPTPSSAMTPNTGGMGMMNTPMPGGMMNPPSPTASTPNAGGLGYIAGSQTGGLGGRKNTNTDVAQVVKAAANQIHLPNVPNPMSLTEGNIGMMASREPLAGSYDPSAVIPTRAAPRRAYGDFRTQRQFTGLQRRGLL